LLLDVALCDVLLPPEPDLVLFPGALVSPLQAAAAAVAPSPPSALAPEAPPSALRNTHHKSNGSGNNSSCSEIGFARTIERSSN
jgi:hypothetical protein